MIPFFSCSVPTQQRQQRADPFFEAILTQLGDYEDSQSSQRKPTDATCKSTLRPTPTPRQHNRSNPAFSPRFDVYETADAYHLNGDLPGVSDKATIGIEFSDERTMSVSGRVDRIRQQPVEKHDEKKDESVAMERKRSLQPTVEDTDDEDDFSIVSASSTKKSEQQKQQVLKSEEHPAKPAAPERKFWVSERTFGNFQRTFSFPSPVDLQKVSAKLEAGLLQIVVPKKMFGGVRKIEIA